MQRVHPRATRAEGGAQSGAANEPALPSTPAAPIHYGEDIGRNQRPLHRLWGRFVDKDVERMFRLQQLPKKLRKYAAHQTLMSRIAVLLMADVLLSFSSGIPAMWRSMDDEQSGAVEAQKCEGRFAAPTPTFSAGGDNNATITPPGTARSSGVPGAGDAALARFSVESRRVFVLIVLAAIAWLGCCRRGQFGGWSFPP